MNQPTGFIRVRVTNSGGEFPLEGAVVTVTDYREGSPAEGALLYSLRTDRTGQTPVVPVPAVSSSLSQSPGAAAPYTLYNIRVSVENYTPAESIGVPVFEGVVSVQPFRLQPLSETALKGSGETDITYEIVDAPGLQNTGYPGGDPAGSEEGGAV